jgi:hypothetical protein
VEIITMTGKPRLTSKQEENSFVVAIILIGGFALATLPAAAAIESIFTDTSFSKVWEKYSTPRNVIDIVNSPEVTS